ncbi:MAG: hypothetical protein WCW68_07275 [Methanothrix sp.]
MRTSILSLCGLLPNSGLGRRRPHVLRARGPGRLGRQVGPRTVWLFGCRARTAIGCGSRRFGDEKAEAASMGP